MSDEDSSQDPGRRSWIFSLLLVASLLPLLFLDLDEASQLASALALPLAILLSGLLAIPGIRRSRRPVPWRTYIAFGVVGVAIVGGISVTYTIWRNTRDIPISFPQQGKLAEPWAHGDQVVLPIPGSPPERGRLAVTVSVANRNTTGACEQTATLEVTPVIDGRSMDSAFSRPDKEVDLSMEGAVRQAEVRIALHYEEGNRRCVVDLRITKAVLHD